MRHALFLYFLAVFLLFVACRREQSLVFSPDQYDFPDAFRLESVASEPLLDAPVALTFDPRGRIWVAEMRGYMTDLDNSGEQLPSGRISILEDTDGDGRMDRRKTVLDSLVLPRALALVYGGLLYAEPPNLWFVEIENDRPGARTLVDSAYATGGNVEHQPNGLLPAMDNWIYSAKSDCRYRCKNGRWLREKTHFRGQWGITQDNFGRLFYNDNSNQLQGDWVLPNALLRNRFFEPSAGFNIQICIDQRVHPRRQTAVNRGYEPGMLDSAGRLRNVTSACGPLIWRNEQAPPGYAGNAFVCAPEANLVKRNVFDPAGGPKLQARQAWPNREFLSSTDPGFRPVNLYEGPDGALYVVDMHRGIIQHKSYMTAYLREQIQSQGLDTILGQGRILRLVPAGQNLQPWPRLEGAKTPELLRALDHPNAWVRDLAQRELSRHRDPAAIPLLQQFVLNTKQPRLQIQALWTLEGLDALDASLLKDAATTAIEPWVALTALHLSEPFVQPDAAPGMQTLGEIMFARQDSTLDLALCLYLGPWARVMPAPVFRLLQKLVERYPQDTLFQEAIVSGLSENEAAFLAFLQQKTPGAFAPYLKKCLKATVTARRENRPAAWTREPRRLKDNMTAGLDGYNSHCGPCHGPTGQGTPNLAPPLNGSEFLRGKPEKLVLIALHGLQGPIQVNGRQYAFNAGMPGLGASPDCPDEALAIILTFVRNAFSTEPIPVTAAQVAAGRQVKPANGVAFTAEELMKR